MQDAEIEERGSDRAGHRVARRTDPRAERTPGPAPVRTFRNRPPRFSCARRMTAAVDRAHRPLHPRDQLRRARHRDRPVNVDFDADRHQATIRPTRNRSSSIVARRGIAASKIVNPPFCMFTVVRSCTPFDWSDPELLDDLERGLFQIRRDHRQIRLRLEDPASRVGHAQRRNWREGPGRVPGRRAIEHVGREDGILTRAHQNNVVGRRITVGVAAPDRQRFPPDGHRDRLRGGDRGM